LKPLLSLLDKQECCYNESMIKKYLFAFFAVMVGSFILSGCKVLVDPQGHYEVQFEENEIEDQVDPWIPKEKIADCGVSNCHGPVECGERVDACTMEYRLGDLCREFASCEETSKGCELSTTKKYDTCIKCIDTCTQIENPQESFSCEDRCRAQIQQ